MMVAGRYGAGDFFSQIRSPDTDNRATSRKEVESLRRGTGGQYKAIGGLAGGESEQRRRLACTNLGGIGPIDDRSGAEKSATGKSARSLTIAVMQISFLFLLLFTFPPFLYILVNYSKH